MGKKKQPKPIGQKQMFEYCKLVLGYKVRHGVSIYDTCTKALVKDGKQKNIESPRLFVFSHAAHIAQRLSGGAAPMAKIKRATVKRDAKPVAAAVSNVVEGVHVASPEFLGTYAWATLRMQALKLHGACCQCCGASRQTGEVMNVDHVKPRKLFPELALVLDNLQVLCGMCNKGKGNWDQTDWRPEEYEPEHVAHLRLIKAHG